MSLLEIIKRKYQSIFKRYFKEPFYICTYISYMEDQSSTIKISGSFPSCKEKGDAILDCEGYLKRNTPIGYVVEYKLYKATLLDRFRL